MGENMKKLVYDVGASAIKYALMDNDGNNITQHQPLISGVNILDQYAYLNIKGIFVVYTEGDANAIPNEDDLGDISNLYFITNN